MVLKSDLKSSQNDAVNIKGHPCVMVGSKSCLDHFYMGFFNKKHYNPLDLRGAIQLFSFDFLQIVAQMFCRTAHCLILEHKLISIKGIFY